MSRIPVANQIQRIFCERVRRKSRLALPSFRQMLLWPATCPFSGQADGKLMQKIHRLTDN
jgi:hypothetical protein